MIHPLPYYALNDLLVTHVNPAAMTSYTLHLGEVSEAQKAWGVDCHGSRLDRGDSCGWWSSCRSFAETAIPHS